MLFMPAPTALRGDRRSVSRACNVWPFNSVSFSSFTALKVVNVINILDEIKILSYFSASSFV